MAQQDWVSKDFYAELGLSKGATNDDIKKAYRKLSRKYHPDLHQGDKSAEEKYKSISEAYSVLKDPKQKKQYDAIRAFGWGGARFNAGQTGGGFSDMFSGMFGTNSKSQFSNQSINLDDILGAFGGGFSNSFSSNGQSGQNYSNRAEQSVKNASVKISFDQAVNGVTVKVLGKKVKIPAGINDGQTIRAKIDGTTVNIKVTVKSDKNYSLEVNNIVLNLPITIAEAALGATIEIPLYPNGTTKIKVPSGIQNGQLLRVKSKGVPEKNGDLILKIKIQVPKKLT